MLEKRSTKNIRRIYMSLLPIQAFALGLPAINNLLDSFIIGNFIGTTGLAAIGFVSPLLMLVNAFSGMIASGSQLLCGQAMGKADRDEICRIYTASIVMCVVIGFMISLATQIFPTQLAILLGAHESALDMTADYIRGIGIGIIFLCLNSCLLPFLQLEKSNKTSTAMIISMLVINVGGDLISIFVFHAGTYGVGIATALSFIVSVVVGAVKLLRSELFHFSFRALQGKTVLAISHLGFPYGLEFFCLMIRNRVINHYIYLLGGTVGMSAMAIANNITTAFGSVLEAGYSGAGRLVSSVLTGQRDCKTLRDLPKIMIRNVWWIYLVLYALVFTLSGPLALLFGAEAEYMATYKLVIRLFNLWYLTNVFKAPPVCIYQGMGRVTLMTLLTLINVLILPCGICIVFGNLFGLAAIASSSWLCEIGLMIILAIIFTVQAKRLPHSPMELVYVPGSISAPHENRYQATIQTLDEAVKASEEVIGFCCERGISSRTAYFCGLSVEEMATDTIRHGFTKPDDAIDLRLIVEDGHVRILLRDVGLKFSPLDWLALCKPEEKERSIGIKMVSELSSEMNYVNTLGMNILTIVL